jgi:hypothetical protein
MSAKNRTEIFPYIDVVRAQQQAVQLDNLVKVDQQDYEFFLQSYSAFICTGGWADKRIKNNTFPAACGGKIDCADQHCSRFTREVPVINNEVHLTKKGQIAMGQDMAKAYINAISSNKIDPI